MIHRFDFGVDKERLLKEVQGEVFMPFVDPKTKIRLEFLSIQFTKKEYANEIASLFREVLDLKHLDARPIFYIQKEGFRFPFHQDRKTQCSINILLDENPDPITFRVEQHDNNMERIDSDIDEYYSTALINTQHWHGVNPPRTTRHLFKVSIFDKTYDECLEIIKAKYD
jgi:hypothetical protein